MAMAAALAAALAPVRAHADELSGTYSDDDVLAETQHAVRVTRDGRVGRFTVLRTLRNGGTHPEEATLSIDLPTGAVARGLRVHLGGRWFTGELLDAEEASERYAELTGAARFGRRGPALLSWAGDGRLSLQVFPVAARGEVTVEYILEAPLCYRDGLLFTDYPVAPGHRLRRPALAAVPAALHSEDELRKRLDVDPDGELCPGIGTAAPAPRTMISFAAAPAGPLAVRFGQVHVDDDHHLVRLEIDVPPIIEPAPRGARVVLVIDGSRSQGREGIAAQLALAGGFVHHLPDATVEVVVYRRGATRLFGRFIPAAGLAAAVDRLPDRLLAPGNGSDADQGLALAGLALRGAGGPARVLLFTDDRLRRGFDVDLAARTAGALPAGAVLHVVDIGPDGVGGASWDRDDEHRLAGVARVRGGIAVRVSGAPGGAPDNAELMLGLVRPLVIEDVVVDGAGEGLFDLPGELRGGDAWRDMRVAGAPAAGWTVRGQLWSRPVAIPLGGGDALAGELAALAFGHPAAADLPEAGAAALARRARVVSAHTSFLARDRAARPTGIPEEWGLGLRGTSSTCGCGSYSTVSHCGVFGTIGHGVGTGGPDDQPDREGMLAAALRGRAAACAGPAGLTGAELVIEATGDEIVDVEVTGAPAAAAACLADAAWQLELPAAYFDLENARYRIALP